MRILTIKDAATWFNNSGMNEWFDDNQTDQLVEYIFRNAPNVPEGGREMTEGNSRPVIEAGIRSLGLDPKLYL